MKKLLIVGAGIEQVPAIRIARELGYFVIATDISSSAPGIQHADKHHKTSTDDFEGNYKVALEEKIDGIMTLCSETAVPVVARVASRLGLPGISEQTALAATHKGIMKESMVRHNVPVPPYMIAANAAEALSFARSHTPPWVIKPIDSSGQRGTTFTHKTDDIPAAFESAMGFSQDKAVLIDQFVEGPEINVTALLSKGEITFLSISNRITLGDPNFGIAARHLAPVQLDTEKQRQIKEISEKAIRAIGLENGIAYPQIIMTDNGPRLMEIAARIPGGHMREVAMYLSGIDMIKTTIWQALGIDIQSMNIHTGKSYPAISVYFITSENLDPGIETIEEISGTDDAMQIEGVVMCSMNLEKGAPVPRLKSSVGRFGSIITLGSGKKEVLSRTAEAFDLIRINGKGLREYTGYSSYNRRIINYR